jgi:predicted nucleic acid-binding protein
MTGLDCNILVQLALQDHPANAVTVSAVQAEAKRGNHFVVPALVIAEFLHVITDAKRFSPPLTMIEALDWVENFIANPVVSVLEPTMSSLDQTLRWMRQFNLGRKRILDTQLAAIFHSAGVRRLLTSNPADFEVFGIFEIVTPTE